MNANQPKQTPDTIEKDRRHFLKQSVIAGSAMAVGSLATSSIARAAHTGVDETLRVGLVGCGGRGTGAVINALKADPNTKLVAVGDAFEDRARSSLEVLGFDENVGDRCVVEEDRIFSGFDAFRQVIDAGVDVVILATPPHFRPEHLEYAVDKRKHVFVEKPIAVDIPGTLRIEETCKRAEQLGLAIVSGLCGRYDLGICETIKRVQDGAIGEIIAIETMYNTGTLWHRGDKPEWSRMEYQMRNWYYYTWLCGDIIVEQAVHNLDRTAWLLGESSPVKAMGIGGRQQRTQAKYGHIYDHFTTFYEYATGQKVFFTCRQQDGCTNRTEDRVLGTKGTAEILANRIEGETSWKYDGPKPSMYVHEHEKLFQSIRSGTPISNADYMINSTRIALMGRIAAYTGKTLTWEELLANQEQLGPKEYDWTDVPEPPVAIPGMEVSV